MCERNVRCGSEEEVKIYTPGSLRNAPQQESTSESEDVRIYTAGLPADSSAEKS